MFKVMAREPKVWSRWVVRDFRDPSDKHREGMFSATPPNEMMRYMISRQATRRKEGKERNTIHMDVKKSHWAPRCEQDIYVELQAEIKVPGDECGKSTHCLYRCMQMGGPSLGRPLFCDPQRARC